MPDLVEFNVGGKRFMTTFDTISFDKKCALYLVIIIIKYFSRLSKSFYVMQQNYFASIYVIKC